MLKKKVLSAITVFMCLSLCAVMAGCGGSSEAPAADEAAGEEAQQTEQAQTVDESVWKAAYLQVLQADEEAIRNYEDMSMNGGNGTAALTDLNGDGTPELLYFLMDEGHQFPYLKIYTIRDGSAAEVSYEKPMAYPEYSDLPQDALYDYQVQGGTRYRIWLSGDGVLYMYSFLYGAENSAGTLNSYRMNSDGQLEQIDCFGLLDETMNCAMEQDPSWTVHYWRDGSEIAEDEFAELGDASVQGIEQLIFDSFKGQGAEGDQVIWSAAGALSPEAVTYDAAVGILYQ